MKTGWALRDPADEFCQPRMGAQRVDGVVVPGKLGLGERGVDFVVADLVEKDCRPALAATEFRDKVVEALARIGRNGALAERADGIVHG